MAWPAPIARLFATLSATWADARPEVDGELDQLVDQTNALLNEGQTQEMRITALQDVVDAINITGVDGLLVSIGPNPSSEIRVEANTIPLSDGTIVSSCNIVGDFYDDPEDGSGGLDTGTIPTVDTWYAAWVVGKGGVADPDPVIVFSLSGDAPDLSRLDAAYNAVKLVHWIRTKDDGAGNAELIPFTHHPESGLVEWLDSLNIESLINNSGVHSSWIAADELDLSDYLPPGSRRLQIDAMAYTACGGSGAEGHAQLWMATMGADDGGFRWRRVMAKSDYYASATVRDTCYDTNQFDLSTDADRAVYARQYQGTSGGTAWAEVDVYINGYYWRP